jgi:exodeoxyribonuclease-3
VKVASFNVNGVNGRLPRLLEWLVDAKPDIACLQEIKTSDDRFPAEALRDAGYESVWHGQRAHHGVAILSRGARPGERRRGLPGDALDVQARYLEAEVDGLTIGSVYLPNGNPQPGPKFDYKLAWFDRLIAHAGELLRSGRSAILAGDFNVVPTNADIYNAWAWRLDAVMQPQARAAYQRLLDQGWVDATRPASRRAHLHLLGQRPGVSTQRRLPHGFPAVEPGPGPAACGERGRSSRTRPRALKRPRSRVGHAHASVGKLCRASGRCCVQAGWLVGRSRRVGLA